MTERIFGHIPGIEVGQNFANRIELSLSRIHPPLQAGISGSQNDGADSIVLSGGYEDDKDYGDIVIYTGHGGRDISTGKQVSHQFLSRQNLALAKNCQFGLPIRVIRGYSHNSLHSPKVGYRYDGLYYVESYWKEKGKSNFDIWRFRLIRDVELEPFTQIIEDRETTSNEEETEYSNKGPVRKQTSVQRIVRDTRVGRAVKLLYNNQCQVCNQVVVTNAGNYSEAAHIQPLGSPHNGPDITENVLCLCPNHHVMFDFGGFSISDNFDLLGLEGKLTINHNHKIDIRFLSYHREHFWE